MKSAKIAVSLPADLYAVLERLRRKRGQSRSALVAEAIAMWARQEELGEAERRYAEAYLKQPEATAETAEVAASAVTQWEPWE